MDEPIRLSNLIAPAFGGVWRRIRAGDETLDELWMDGGRGSCKSSFASIVILAGLLDDPSANAIIYRKVADTLRESVYEQMAWAIDRMGLSGRFTLRKSPLEIVCERTGQKILFRGADNPEKSKGVKLARGYFRYLWFEELTEFDGMGDVRTIIASVFRGTGVKYRPLTIYSYNPPRSGRNWVNEEALKAHAGRVRHHSDYTTVPPEWLGARFIAQAEALRADNETEYRHMYLGEVTGTGGEVFANVEVREIKPEEWQGLYTYSGLDFGFAGDPDAYVRCAYDRKRRRLYLLDEFVACGQLMEALGKTVRARCANDVITCDCAEPRSVAQLRTMGLRVISSKKGPDSVEHGVGWLQTRAKIIIDARKCPYAAKEFSQYEYDRDKSGNAIPRYPDKNNHTIDATRYAMESVSALKAAVVPR